MRTALTEFTPTDYERVDFRAPSVFLSASLPLESREEGRYMPAFDSEIRQAVVQLVRKAFAENVLLIFGGHPATTPLVLSMAQNTWNSGKAPLRVVIYQTGFFEHLIPEDTKALSNWSSAQLVWTPSDGPPPRTWQEARSRPQQQANSLKKMRKTMVGSPGLRGAVFIGGMNGCLDEAGLFVEKQPRLPVFALPTTGGAAQMLYEHRSGRPRLDSTLFGPQSLAKRRPMSAHIRGIFRDIRLIP